MMGKTVAVLLPVHVPGSMFRELIRRLSRQSHVPEKVIIINTIDPEKDCTLFLDSLAEEFEGSFGCIEIYHIQKSEFGHGKTRDMGIRRAGTDLVLCMTQDALPKDRHLVEKLEDAFDDPSVAAAYGRQLAGRRAIFSRERRGSSIIRPGQKSCPPQIWRRWGSRLSSARMYAPCGEWRLTKSLEALKRM